MQVPLLFMAVALAVQALPAAFLASKRYAHLMPDYRIRLLVATAYLVVPNSWEINVNLTDAQWHLGLLAVLVVLAVPSTGGWRIFDVAVIVLSGLTGPFGISVVVVAAIYYYRRRKTWTLVLGALHRGGRHSPGDRTGDVTPWTLCRVGDVGRPVRRDRRRSVDWEHGTGNADHHLHAVHRALPLVFGPVPRSRTGRSRLCIVAGARLSSSCSTSLRDWPWPVRSPRRWREPTSGNGKPSPPTLARDTGSFLPWPSWPTCYG